MNRNEPSLSLTIKCFQAQDGGRLICVTSYTSSHCDVVELKRKKNKGTDFKNSPLRIGYKLFINLSWKCFFIGRKCLLFQLKMSQMLTRMRSESISIC